ncbi:serine/threonine protein kinase [Labilithrix luteola]|uniref:Serine/threonine protein kinase n=1 Tax=Labilithrix luteola TaxID=1391654 RepID=A0A0K1PW56_9BACT|nr:serine/threonine-protein kinase [Labilithrix luteola]AKU97631.1 serine/threonine protein kinase [Labilithrix luteola]
MYPQVFGKYVLERELSRGGMARVLLATLRGAGGFEKRLVVKQIRDELAFDQQFVRRFVEEAKTTVALSHPNIVPVYELGVEQGTYFLAMELVEGVSIAELLRERTASGSRRVLSPEEAAYVGIEVCRALDYAHRRMKVVHRDITPRNVMLDEEGQVKLIDFGIAAPARVAGHEIFGSPGHMPPEQVEGKELGPATDVFAIAVLLMEAWTGTAPFRRATPEECDEAMRRPHPRPSDFDARLAPLDDTIARAMRLDPSERQQDAAEVGRALRSYLQGADVDQVARRLGERVRKLRAATSEPAHASRATGPRTTNPSHGDFGTKTFATREDALRWSERPPAPETTPRAPGTRKIDEAPDKKKAVDPMMSVPTPLMVESIAIERALEDAKLKEPETIATKPLETPVRRPDEMRVESAPRSRRGAAIVAAGVLVILAVLGWKAKDAAKPEVDPSRVASSASTALPSMEPVPKLAPAPAVSSSAPAVVAASASVTPPASATPSSSATQAGRAQVTLLGDPGTRVSIDGVARGACPVRLNLEPGQHEAAFTFDPTGEGRSVRVGVKSGDRVTVRADFTSATPTVKILR